MAATPGVTFLVDSGSSPTGSSASSSLTQVTIIIITLWPFIFESASE